MGKQFQYDVPGDLVMTFLSEVCYIAGTILVVMNRHIS